jgi:hypothetical protein
MAQAEYITIAIRELMSRGRPPKSTMRLAHIELVAALAGNGPHPTALHVYLSAIIADTVQSIPGSALDRRYLDNLFEELSADAPAALRNAAEEMRDHENWRVS